MTRSITDISGIGAITAKILKEQGYNTLEDLAAADVEDLSKLHGFGAIRARQIIDLAKSHVTNNLEPQEPVEITEKSASEKTTSEPTKKKKKDKKEKKNKKKDKEVKKEKKKKKKEQKKKKGSKKKK